MATGDIPVFFLTTAGETRLLSVPRTCSPVRRLQIDSRTEDLLVAIDPALTGQSFGLGADNIHHLILSPKHQGHSLFSIKEWPTHVYVSRFLGPGSPGFKPLTASQIEMIAWGKIFQTHEAAMAAATESESELP